MSFVLRTAVLGLMAFTPFVVRAEPKPGDKAPDFELVDFEGTKRKLADYKGQLLVLEWTCTECPFTLEHYERGTMIKLAEKYKDKVKWVGIDSSANTSESGLYNWSKRWKITWPILMDPAGSVGHKYGATATPQMFIIDKEGILRYRGAVDDDASNSKKLQVNYVDAALKSLLAGEKVKEDSTVPYGCGIKYLKLPF